MNPDTRSLLDRLDQVASFLQDLPIRNAAVSRWSIGQQAEHVIRATSAFTVLILRNRPSDGSGDIRPIKNRFFALGMIPRGVAEAPDVYRPVAMANGDLAYLDLIVHHAADVDVFGANIYRGASFTDAYETLATTLDRPILWTEFGSDAWNARTAEEAQSEQSTYLLSQWKEIYANAPGQGGLGNSIGGLTFQWSDGWWKYNQEAFLDVHDTHASWFNGGYAFDYEDGANNMNEEWFGVMAKGPTDERMQFDLIPRAAYFTLQEIHRANPLALSSEQLKSHLASQDTERHLMLAQRHESGRD